MGCSSFLLQSKDMQCNGQFSSVGVKKTSGCVKVELCFFKEIFKCVCDAVLFIYFFCSSFTISLHVQDVCHPKTTALFNYT